MTNWQKNTFISVLKMLATVIGAFLGSNITF